ncbi:MAG TPA: bifunctional diguanylate cyclase/phosphodiesterase [Acidimicrobiia bacterium]|nr:bifunctional diguanylate cyclase/phosphodiesterase [Acidimicrobiia bacterium]
MATRGAGSAGEAAARRGVGDDVPRLTAVEPIGEELAESEARFRAMLQYTADVVVVRGLEGEVRYISPSVKDVLGYTPEELAELTLLELVHAEDHDRVLQTAARLAERPGAWEDIQYRVRHRDGSWRWFRSRMANLFDDPAVGGIITCSWDETERRHALDLGARSEEALRAVVESSPLGIFAVSPDGATRLWNHACEQIFGWTESEVRGQPLPFVTVSDQQRLAQTRRRYAAGESIESSDILALRKDGAEVYVNISSAPVRAPDGTVSTVMGVVADVTDRKRAVEALTASEERFRALVQHSAELVVVWNGEGELTYVSPSAERFGDYHVGDVTGSKDPPLVHPDDRDGMLEVFADLRERPGGVSAPFLVRMRNTEDEYRWLEVLATNLLDDPAVQGMVLNARDVTERVEAEAALHKTDERFRALVQNSSDMVVVLDPAGAISYTSPSLERVLEHPDGSLIGRSAFELVHPHDRESATEALARAFSDPDWYDIVEVRVAHADGSWRDVELVGSNLLDDPAVGGLVVNARDVTDRRQAEEALHRTDERFRALAQNASDMITVLDPEGRTLYASPSAARVMGYPDGWGLGDEHFDLVHPDDLDEVARVFAEAAKAPGPGPTTQVRVRAADGSWRWIETVTNNLIDEPAVGGIVVTARDVTEQRAAEEAVRESEERFRALVQHASDVIAVLDGDGTLRYASPSVQRLFGFPYGRWFGHSALDLVHPDDVPMAMEALAEAAAQPGAEAHLELRLAHADGSWRNVEIIGSNHLEDPAVAGLVLNIRDVTERTRAEEARRESEQRYRAIVEDQTELICRYQGDGTLTFVNDAYARYFGGTVEELVGVNWLELLPDEGRAKAEAMLAGLDAEHPVRVHEQHVVIPDGRTRWQQWTNRLVLDDNGDIGEYQAVGRDVTEKWTAEALVVEQARILELIAQGAALDDILTDVCRVVENHAPGATCSVLLLDEGGTVLRHGAAPSLPQSYLDGLADGVEVGPNAGSCGTAAHRADRVVVTDIMSDPLWDDFRELAMSHDLRACWSTPVTSSADGRVLGTFAIYYREPRAPSAEHVQLVDLMVHLTTIAIERKANESRLAYQAHHDPLTGLPNRMLFLEFLVLALARSRRVHSRVAVLFLDLDRFKFVNDSLGHDAGDELLVALGDRLRSALRPGDTVARFGGDEFVVLCEDLAGREARRQAVDVADRLLDVICPPFQTDAGDQFLSASIGIAIAKNGDERPEELLRDSDAAMYRAKERGKGRWEVFDDAMRASALERLEIENALHRAVDRREFRVVYQPVVALSDRRCVGAEALVRWQHPTRGLLPPGEFVDLAEESGLIVPVGKWVLEEACDQAAKWETEGDIGDFVVSVNLSARQLAHSDTPAYVAAALAQSGIDPARLSLEITESVLMDDAESTMGAITALRNLGVGFSIDDFGTGYSSLGYLKRFPVDSVKVDRSFVSGLGSNPEDTAIVAAVVSLGHALGLTVVAEGVETERQLEELVALGCDTAQGFYFAEPQAPTDMNGIRPGALVP